MNKNRKHFAYSKLWIKSFVPINWQGKISIPFSLIVKRKFEEEKLDCAIFVPLFPPLLNHWSRLRQTSCLHYWQFSFFVHFKFFPFLSVNVERFKRNRFIFVQCLEFFSYFCLSFPLVVFRVQLVGKNQGENKMKIKL